MSPKTFFVTLLQFALAAAVLLLSHYGYTVIAVPLVLGPMVVTWLQNRRSLDGLLAGSPTAVIGLSIVVLVGLDRQPIGQAVFPVTTQLLLTIFYWIWLIRLRQQRLQQQASLIVLGVQQVVAMMALFLAAAFWHWPEAVVVGLSWAVIMVTTFHYLKVAGERAAAILAAAWALVAAELAWVLYIWQVNYLLFNGYVIVPQASLVTLGVGYCFASIYHSHTEKRLSRRRLIEYVAIAGVLLAIVIAGTRWNGTA